jgi:hypothetical protein
MFRLTVILTLLYCLTGCSNTDNKSAIADKPILSAKADKDLPGKNEEKAKATCIFDNPDTSLSDIKLRDAESAINALKVKRLNGDTTYNFYSQNKSQLLSVTVHPGDNYSQVSIFQIKYADNSKIKAAPTTLDSLVTEKNIRLGITKNEVVSKLGNCYTTNDSTKHSVTINYRLESPQDSRTQLLERQNMPIYYATYKFKKDKLIEFEFGFEYP